MKEHEDVSSSDWLDFRSPRGRVAMYLSAILILLSAVVLALLVGKHWSWGPFLLALVVAVVLLLPYFGVLRIATPALKLSPDRPDEARTELPRRLVPSYPAMALWIGIVAASFRVYWPVAVYAALTLVGLIVLPLVLLPQAKRKAAPGHSSQGPDT